MIHNDYYMFMSCNAETDCFLFPVLPEKIQLTDSVKNTSVIVSNLGEITIIEKPGADTISWNCRFPAHRNQDVVVDKLFEPKYYYDKLEKWRLSEKPVHFILTCIFDINGYYTIEDLSYDEQWGDIGTINYSIKLKKYNKPTARKLNLSKDGTTAEITKEIKRVDNTIQEKTYTVVKGDSLYKIAKAKLGDGSKWKEIYNLNKDKIKNPNVIQVGLLLKLPEDKK